MSRRAARAVVAATLWVFSWGTATLGLVGCGDGKVPSDLLPETVQLQIWNQSEFEILELYVTPNTTYSGAANLLDSPLPNTGRFGVSFQNRSHVTVVRRRVAAGERVAFTTARRLELDQNGYTLVVFQESFRLLDPDPSQDGAPRTDGASPGDPDPAGD